MAFLCSGPPPLLPQAPCGLEPAGFVASPCKLLSVCAPDSSQPESSWFVFPGALFESQDDHSDHLAYWFASGLFGALESRRGCLGDDSGDSPGG